MSASVGSRAPADAPLARFVRDYARSTTAMLAAVVLFALVFAAVSAPYLTPQNPYDLAVIDIMDGRAPPLTHGADGTLYVLGTDEQGRDLLSAIVYGLRISLGVGVGSAVVSCAIGSALGLLAGYRGGRADAAIMRLVDLQLAFPAELAALMLLAFLGRGVGNVLLALVLGGWPYFARAARGSALAEVRREYIEAARCLALPTRRIVFGHLLPNCAAPIIVIFTAQLARAIALEATLSFLGLGVPVTEPSLGLLIANGFQYMLSGTYWISVFPGVALVIVIVALNLVGDRVRDVLNVRAH